MSHSTKGTKFLLRADQAYVLPKGHFQYTKYQALKCGNQHCFEPTNKALEGLGTRSALSLGDKSKGHTYAYRRTLEHIQNTQHLSVAGVGNHSTRKHTQTRVWI